MWRVMALIATAALFTGAGAAPALASQTLLSADDGGWTWFNYPNAVRVGARTHFAYIDGAGHPMAAYVDGGVVSTPVDLYPSGVFEVDDHDDPALIVRPSDGALLAYFSKHLGADQQYVNVWNGSAWSGPTQIGDDINADQGSYMQPVSLANGTIRVFFRNHYDAGASVQWAYSDASDGVTFSGYTPFIDDQGDVTYIRAFDSGAGRIDFVVSGHPAYDTGSLWHLYYEGGSYYQTDGTLIESALPLDVTDMTLVYDGTTTKGWLWDIARIDGELAITFATFPDNDGSEHRYQYAKWTGASWSVNQVADAGDFIKTAGAEVFYSGGIVIDRLDINRVYYSSNAAGDFDIFRAMTGDDGATWSATALTSDSTKDVRPKPVLNPSAALRVVWMRGTYAEYTDWNTGTSGGT